MIKDKITILGLGYVGLPLAIEFQKFNVYWLIFQKNGLQI